MTPPYIPQIRLYQNWLREQRGLDFKSYAELWEWSVTDLDAYWQSIWDCFGMRSPTPHTAALAENRMPGARWFPGAKINYTQQVFRHVDMAEAGGFPAIVSHNEKSLAAEQPARELSWTELRRQVASLALHLKEQGVQPGDRVVAYMPNIPETIIAFLATASLGAVWSVCAPDMGTAAVLDRFKQIEPKVLIACDGVTYGGRDTDRRSVVAEICAALPTVRHLIVQANLRLQGMPAVRAGVDVASFAAAVARDDASVRRFEPLPVAFDHPLWVVYSSGTTGLPKPIVHGHGGIVIVTLGFSLNSDIGCSYAPNTLGERFHWYSSTGWIMWNFQTSGLLTGTTLCLFDGNPGGATVDPAGNKKAPDWSTLWRFVSDVGATFFGAGAAFYASCMKAGLDLASCGPLSRVRGLGSTGSPLSEDVQRWVNAQMRRINPTAGGTAKDADIWWCNISGGTDFAGAFVGGCRELPQVPGEMQCRLLGCAVEAWSEQGEPVVDAVGELVCAQPIPSMPLYFWNDDGNQRYLSSYFDMYPAGHGRKPGGGDAGPEAGPVWRHGDWLMITSRGSCIIYGRSDATINRYGLRMGTSELYSAVEGIPEVMDSMVVDLEYLGRESYMPLFIVLRPGLTLDEALKARINNAIKTALSPRFVPNEVLQVAEIPRTLSGKKQELPIKKLMLGQPIEKVVNKDAMANPACLDWYVSFANNYLARQRAASGGTPA